MNYTVFAHGAPLNNKRFHFFDNVISVTGLVWQNSYILCALFDGGKVVRMSSLVTLRFSKSVFSGR